MAGRAPEAAAELEKALELYEKKDNVVMAQRTREKLSDIGTSSPPTRLK